MLRGAAPLSGPYLGLRYDGDMSDWKSRIIGEGEEDPAALTLNPKNWRLHPEAQSRAVEEALERLGWIQRVIVNRRTGRLIDGHLRVELARQRGEQMVPVLYVDLSEEEEALALATLDPLAALAETDEEALAALLEQVNLEEGALMDALAEVVGGELDIGEGAGGDEDYYTPKLDGLIYEPQEEEPPPVDELFDTSKAEELQRRVEEVNIPEDLRPFFLAAASRFTSFRFDRIAEFYAHASPEVQELMEELALVIVDHDRAIELGFSHLSEVLAGEYEAVMGGGDGEA